MSDLMKTLLITMVLAIACTSPIVAAEKQQQTNLQNEVISNNADNGTTPISLDAVYEFIKAEGHPAEFNTVENLRYIAFEYKEAVSLLFIEKDFVIFQMGYPDISERIKSKFKIKKLSDKEIAGIYATCVDMSRLVRCVKLSYRPENDVVTADIETFIPTMEIFKHYFSTYMDIVRVSIATFEESLFDNVEESRKN